MRARRIAIALTALVALGGLLPAVPASAAVPNVLTYGGGYPVSPNSTNPDVISATQAPFTTATFTAAPNGYGMGTTCTSTSTGPIISGPIASNPVSPGTATGTVTTMGFGNSCSSTIPGVTSVISVAINNVSLGWAFSDATNFPVTIYSPTPIQIVIKEVFSGTVVPCTWQMTSGVMHANYVNANSKLVLFNLQIALVSGPGGACGASPQFVNAAYAPFTDTAITAGPNQVSIN